MYSAVVSATISKMPNAECRMKGGSETWMQDIFDMQNESIWLDQILSVPAIGVSMVPWLGFASGIWEPLARLAERRPSEAQITAPNPLSVRMERNNGTYLDLKPDNLTFGHNYKIKVQEEAGGLPSLQQSTGLKTYSSLLEELMEDANAILKDTLGSGTRSIVRIGVVADCRLVATDLPPGVEAWLQSLTALWTKPLKVIDATYLIECNSADTIRDQCHHTISNNAYDRPLDVRVKLDWQRVWTPPKPMGIRTIEEQLTNTVSSALEYFSQFGIDGGSLCPTQLPPVL